VNLFEHLSPVSLVVKVILVGAGGNPERCVVVMCN